MKALIIIWIVLGGLWLLSKCDEGPPETECVRSHTEPYYQYQDWDPMSDDPRTKGYSKTTREVCDEWAEVKH